MRVKQTRTRHSTVSRKPIVQTRGVIYRLLQPKYKKSSTTGHHHHHHIHSVPSKPTVILMCGDMERQFEHGFRSIGSNVSSSGNAREPSPQCPPPNVLNSGGMTTLHIGFDRPNSGGEFESKESEPDLKQVEEIQLLQTAWPKPIRNGVLTNSPPTSTMVSVAENHLHESASLDSFTQGDYQKASDWNFRSHSSFLPGLFNSKLDCLIAPRRPRTNKHGRIFRLLRQTPTRMTKDILFRYSASQRTCIALRRSVVEMTMHDSPIQPVRRMSYSSESRSLCNSLELTPIDNLVKCTVRPNAVSIELRHAIHKADLFEDCNEDSQSWRLHKGRRNSKWTNKLAHLSKSISFESVLEMNSYLLVQSHALVSRLRFEWLSQCCITAFVLGLDSRIDIHRTCYPRLCINRFVLEDLQTCEFKSMLMDVKCCNILQLLCNNGNLPIRTSPTLHENQIILCEGSDDAVCPLSATAVQLLVEHIDFLSARIQQPAQYFSTVRTPPSRFVHIKTKIHAIPHSQTGWIVVDKTWASTVSFNTCVTNTISPVQIEGQWISPDSLLIPNAIQWSGLSIQASYHSESWTWIIWDDLDMLTDSWFPSQPDKGSSTIQMTVEYFCECFNLLSRCSNNPSVPSGDNSILFNSPFDEVKIMEHEEASLLNELEETKEAMPAHFESIKVTLTIHYSNETSYPVTVLNYTMYQGIWPQQYLKSILQMTVNEHKLWTGWFSQCATTTVSGLVIKMSLHGLQPVDVLPFSGVCLAFFMCALIWYKKCRTTTLE